jgi:DNA-binding NtrC family response regulator
MEKYLSVIRKYPLLSLLSNRKNLIVFMDKSGTVRYCYKQSEAKKITLANNIVGKKINTFFRLPSSFTMEACKTGIDTWPGPSASLRSFLSTPLCDRCVLPAFVYTALPQCAMYLFRAYDGIFLGVIYYHEFEPSLSLSSSEIMVLKDPQNRIVAYNQSLLNLLRPADPLSFLGTWLNRLVYFSIKDRPSQSSPADMVPVKTDARAFMPFGNGSFAAGPKGVLHIENRSDEANFYVHLNLPLKHDLHDYRFRFTVKKKHGTLPGLMIRALQNDPPDSYGYLFGPDLRKSRFIFKKMGVIIKSVPVPDLERLSGYAVDIVKTGNRIRVRLDGRLCVSYEEFFDFPAAAGGDLTLFLRKESASEISGLSLSLCEPREKRAQFVAGEFKEAPQNKYRVYQEPCYFHNRQYTLCRFENITGYENEISRLRLERDRIESTLRKRRHLDRFVGNSGVAQGLKETLATLSQSASTLLLVGGTGTGKEILAGLFHQLSPRAGKPFVKLDCSTLPPTLIESELFGYEKGAFTGAHAAHAGKFEQANGGTLFLDEISNLTLETQAKLLGVIEDLRITRLGGVKPMQLALNIVAASNKNLGELMRQKLFRDDLYFRLNRFKLDIPPLRGRQEDLPLLCQEFIHQANREYGKSVRSISEEGHRKLYDHAWPGNVRELKNVIFKAVLFSRGPVIHPASLDLSQSAGRRPGPATGTKKGRVTEAMLVEAMKETGGNVMAAAERLGVTRATVYNRLRAGKTGPGVFRT